MVDERRQQVRRRVPLHGFAVQVAVDRAVAWHVLDQHREASRRERPAVPVQQVNPVVPQQIGFQSLGVFGYERVEAQSSPRPSPVSWP
ncbi:hypothetical protein GCM10010214_57090 [Streptomyces abikoensis]|nr:hypothetical protein GCM10010214_57090 [Streptomyces abikoensis]